MRLSLLIFTAFLMGACSDAGPKEDASPASPTASACSWDSGVQLIFEGQCGSCHPGSQATDYKTFAGVKAGIDAEMVRINNNTMPPGGMTATNKALVTAWVDKGLPKTDAEAGDCKTQ